MADGPYFYDVIYQDGADAKFLRRLRHISTGDPDFLTFLLNDGRKLVLGKRFIVKMEESKE